MYASQNRIGKNNTTGNASPILRRTYGVIHDIRINRGFNLSMLCCFYLLFGHVLVLGFDGAALIRGTARGKTVDTSLLSLSVSHCLAWFVLGLPALHCKFKVSVKFPFLLRVWWFLSYIICLCTLYVDGRGFWMEGSKHLCCHVAANFAVTPALAFLCIVAMRGGTGIQVCTYSELDKPLLPEEEPECFKVTPYSDAGPFSLATLSWVNSLPSVGAKRPFELKDIPLLAPKDRAKTDYKVLNSGRNGLGSHQVILEGGSLYLTGVNTLVSYVGPYMISYFVDYLSGKHSFPRKVYILVGTLFVAKLLSFRDLDNSAMVSWSGHFGYAC